MQEQSQAASLRQEVSRLGSEVSRLQSELNQERGSKEQHASRVATLQQDLQQEKASLVCHIEQVTCQEDQSAVMLSCHHAPVSCTYIMPQKFFSGSAQVHVYMFIKTSALHMPVQLLPVLLCALRRAPRLYDDCYE